MRKVFWATFAMCALAFSTSAFAAFDGFKPTGIEAPGFAQAVAKPDPAKAMARAAVETAAAYAAIHHKPARFERERSWEKTLTADDRPMASLKQIGTHADRGDKARKSDRMQV